jgi:hypothetical protein
MSRLCRSIKSYVSPFRPQCVIARRVFATRRQGCGSPILECKKTSPIKSERHSDDSDPIGDLLASGVLRYEEERHYTQQTSATISQTEGGRGSSEALDTTGDPAAGLMLVTGQLRREEENHNT